MKQNEMSLVIVAVKVLAIFLTGDLAAYLYISHARLAFTVGLVIGVILQSIIPPRGSVKQNILLSLVAVTVGVLRFLISS